MHISKTNKTKKIMYFRHFGDCTAVTLERLMRSRQSAMSAHRQRLMSVSRSRSGSLSTSFGRRSSGFNVPHKRKANTFAAHSRKATLMETPPPVSTPCQEHVKHHPGAPFSEFMQSSYPLKKVSVAFLSSFVFDLALSSGLFYYISLNPLFFYSFCLYIYFLHSTRVSC